MRRQITLFGLAVAMGTLCAPWPGVAAGLDQGSEKSLSPVIETKEGPVQGFTSNGVTEFLGVPYAEPPVGNLRWQPPKDHAPWTNVRKATEFAPICALTTTLGVFSGPQNNNEDCLYLNVFTPDLNSSARLPVIVWIHGGGNIDGETPGYDGSKLASQGKTVVVTLAYRLNLMGFLAHPALDTEGHPFGNYGILDQQAVLKWVERNIARFGWRQGQRHPRRSVGWRCRHRTQHGLAARRRPVPPRNLPERLHAVYAAQQGGRRG